MSRSASKYAKQHTFEGELRVKVNRKMYPNIDEEGVMELVQRVLEGETVEGIIVQTFEVRGEDKTSEVSKNYAAAASFMRSATRQK